MANLLISYIIYINYDTIFIWFAGSFNSWHNDWCTEYDDHPKRNSKSKRNEKFFWNWLYYHISYGFIHVGVVWYRRIPVQLSTTRIDLVVGRVWKMLGIKSMSWAMIYNRSVIDILKVLFCWATHKVAYCHEPFWKCLVIRWMWNDLFLLVHRRQDNMEVCASYMRENNNGIGKNLVIYFFHHFSLLQLHSFIWSSPIWQLKPLTLYFTHMLDNIHRLATIGMILINNRCIIILVHFCHISIMKSKQWIRVVSEKISFKPMKLYWLEDQMMM